ncbi:hypothetical protein STTU_3338 [Streptomyces sp. Tu6071]|nr:hypothetical protein STTU_3338 [Streptomyces sp. Tu6071]
MGRAGCAVRGRRRRYGRGLGGTGDGLTGWRCGSGVDRPAKPGGRPSRGTGPGRAWRRLAPVPP